MQTSFKVTVKTLAELLSEPNGTWVVEDGIMIDTRTNDTITKDMMKKLGTEIDISHEDYGDTSWRDINKCVWKPAWVHGPEVVE